MEETICKGYININRTVYYVLGKNNNNKEKTKQKQKQKEHKIRK